MTHDERPWTDRRWIDTGSGGGYDPGETPGQRTARLYAETIEKHTPAEPGGDCPVCGYPDCEERRLARFQYVLGPGGAIPGNSPEQIDHSADPEAPALTELDGGD